MNKPIYYAIDAFTQTVIEREMTDEEFAEWQAVAAVNPPTEETPTE